MDRNPSHEELRLGELLDQFLNLSGDNDNAGRVVFRGPHGEYVGEVKLSAADVAAAIEALRVRNQARDAMEASRPAEQLPQVDADEVSAMVSALEDLANGGE
jgi:hypothetical protein